MTVCVVSRFLMHPTLGRPHLEICIKVLKSGHTQDTGNSCLYTLLSSTNKHGRRCNSQALNGLRRLSWKWLLAKVY